MAEEQKGLKLLVRLGNATLDGKRPIYQELRKVKGVSFMYASAVLTTLKIDKNKITGTLTEDEADKIERQIKKPQGIPAWLLNRQKDYETGENIHLISSDLDFVKDNDIKRLKKIRTYRGARHTNHQPTRGQKTRSHFRTKKKSSSGIKASSVTKAPSGPKGK